MFGMNYIERYLYSLPEYRQELQRRNFVEIYSYNGLLATRKIIEFDGDTVLCRVCGDKASGFHYGVHACEGCKGFFRRSIQQKIQYRPCLKNQQCNITRVNRNRCQYCRLKKCIAVGMSRDAVRFGRVPKKEKAKIQQRMDEVNKQAQVIKLDSVLQSDTELLEKITEAHLKLCQFTQDKLHGFIQQAWRKAEFVNCPVHVACPLNPSPENSDGVHQWEQFSDCITPAIRSVVSFAKSIPGFEFFSQEDQVTLLKAGTFEVLLVHLSCLFDDKTNTMLFVNGKLYKRVAMPQQVTSSAGFLLDSMFDFAARMNDLRLKDQEIALFSALVIISSDRPGLRNVEQIERIQSRILQGLQMMMKVNHPDDLSAFQKLLLKIPDLRTLNTLHSEKLLGLPVPQSGDPACKTEAPTTMTNENHQRVNLVNISKTVSSFFPNPLIVPPSLQPTCPASYTAMAPPPIYSPTAADGAPIIPHHVSLDEKQRELVLQTPQGTFHRHQAAIGPMTSLKTERDPLAMEEEHQRHLEEALRKNEMLLHHNATPINTPTQTPIQTPTHTPLHTPIHTPIHTPQQSARNSRSCSPEPLEMDMPHLAQMVSGQKVWQQDQPRIMTDAIYSEKKKRPYDDRDMEVDNKAQRIEDGMRSHRSNSLGGSFKFGPRPHSDSLSTAIAWDYSAHRARSNSLSTRFERTLKIRNSRANLNGDRSSLAAPYSVSPEHSMPVRAEQQSQMNSSNVHSDQQPTSSSSNLNSERQVRSNSFSANGERQARSNSFSVNSDHSARSNSFSTNGERQTRSNSFSANIEDLRSSRSNSVSSNWEYDMRTNRSDSMSSSASLESYDSGYRTNPPTPRTSFYDIRLPSSAAEMQGRPDTFPVSKASAIGGNPRDKDISQIPEENEDGPPETDKSSSIGRDLPTLKSVLTAPPIAPNQWFLKSRVGFVERRGGVECPRSASPNEGLSKRYRKVKLRPASSESNSPEMGHSSGSDDQKCQSPLSLDNGGDKTMAIPRVEITDTSKHRLSANASPEESQAREEMTAKASEIPAVPWQLEPGLAVRETRPRAERTGRHDDLRPRSYSHSETSRSAMVSLKDKILKRMGSRENLHRVSREQELPMETEKSLVKSGEGAGQPTPPFGPFVGAPMPYMRGMLPPHPAYYPVTFPQMHPMYFIHAMQQCQALQAQQQQQQPQAQQHQQIHQRQQVPVGAGPTDERLPPLRPADVQGPPPPIHTSQDPASFSPSGSALRASTTPSSETRAVHKPWVNAHIAVTESAAPMNVEDKNDLMEERRKAEGQRNCCTGANSGQKQEFENDNGQPLNLALVPETTAVKQENIS